MFSRILLNIHIHLQLHFKVVSSFNHLAGKLMNSLVLNLGRFPGRDYAQRTSFAGKTNVELEHLFPIISKPVMLQTLRLLTQQQVCFITIYVLLFFLYSGSLFMLLLRLKKSQAIIFYIDAWQYLQ